MRRTALAVLLASFAVLLVPGSVQPLDSGAAAHSRALQGAAALAKAKQAGIDVGGIIETVEHRVVPVRGGTGLLRAEDGLYRVDFGRSGFALSLRARLSEDALAAKTKAWRASLPPQPADRRSLPSEQIPFQSRPAVRLETSAISRGDTRFAVAPARWRSQRNEASRVLVPGLSERVRAREGRLEWDFVLSRPPRGAGALRIEANVAAAGESRRLAHGRRWRLSEGRHLQLGELIVRDADGTQLYRTPPAVSHGRVVLDVPAPVLEQAAYPLTLDPVISPEYAVSEPVYGADPTVYASSPALAFAGVNYLVVWEDHTSRDGHINFGDVYGARVSPAGSVLDPAGFVISSGPDGQTAPAVAFDGADYVVVWTDEHSNDYIDDIYGARVSTAGTVLDPAGIPISTAPSNQSSPALAFDGTNLLVTWVDQRSGDGDVYGTRVSPAGTVLDPSGLPISTAPGYQGGPAVAFDGTNYLVAWSYPHSGYPYRSDIYGARVSPAGSVLDPDGIAIAIEASNQILGALAFDGTNYLAVWRNGCASICGSRVSPAGVVLDPEGIEVSSRTVDYNGGPSLAFDGNDYLVVWGDLGSGEAYDRDIYGARVSTGGTVLDPAGIPISTAVGNDSMPVVAFGGTNYLVAWQHGSSVSGARVSPAGSVLDETGVALSSRSVDYQHSPALAFDGTNYLVIWEHPRPVGPEIYGARVNASGELLDGSGIPISTAAVFQWTPSVAFDGTNYLVVWLQSSEPFSSDVAGARVSPAGTVLDPGGIPIAHVGISGGEPAVAFDGESYLVVWSTHRDLSIAGARVSLAGSLLDPDPFTISTFGCVRGAHIDPALAFDGENYLVLWAYLRQCGDVPSGIYGARVSPAGTVVDPHEFAISTTTAGQEKPALAFDGTNYLVAWDADPAGYPNYDLFGARVSTAGVVLDPNGIAISTAAGSQEAPAVAFEGRNYVVAWEDDRSGASSDVLATRVSPDGEVLDPAGLGIATSASDETAPALAVPRPGRVAVGYERVAPESPYDGASRVFLRFLGTGPANDDWANAEAIGPGSSPRSGTTLDATGEPGEPDHARSAAPLNSVWYAFTLPRTTIVQLDTCGSGFDTVLAVYTGTGVDSLTQVRANDNGCGHQSRIVFRAQAGVRYTAALDGAGSATGPFTLTFSGRQELPTRRRPGS